MRAVTPASLFAATLLWLPLAQAAPPEARVEVAGVGSVSLADAMRTCESETPTGEIRAAQGSHRVAAFQGILTWLLPLDEEAKRAYLGTDAPWPAEPHDVSYQPPLDWVPAGLIGACEAAGSWWVRHGLSLLEVCPDDRKACIERLTPHYAPEDARVVRRVLRAARKSEESQRDPFFVELNQVADALDLWTHPLPYLQKACDLPQISAMNQRFIDDQDLAAARRACLQIQWLVQGISSPPSALSLPCETEWSALQEEDGRLLPTPGTDLAFTSRFRVSQLDTLGDRLHGMDPTPGACTDDAGWASIWRGALADAWQRAQQTGACDDPFLALPQRLRLCPDLLAHTQARCAAEDPWACKAAGLLHLDGLVQPADLDQGVSFTIQACAQGRVQGCADLAGRVEALNGWFSRRLTEARRGPEPERALTEAQTGLLLLRSYAESGWSQAQAERLFAAALAARHQPVASGVLAAFEADADPRWVRRARAALDRLPPPSAPAEDEG